MKKPITLIVILSFATLGIIFILWKNLVALGTISIFIAWLIGIFAILQTQIKELFFSPILGVKVEEVLTTTVGGWQEKWFNLVVKNCGYSTAKNIKIKIRDGEHKSWINLLRPFAGMRPAKDRISIRALTAKEDEAFNIGHSDSRNNKFELATNLIPNNQKTILNSGESHNYFVNIVSDNAKPLPVKININNPGYSQISTSNITINKK